MNDTFVNYHVYGRDQGQVQAAVRFARLGPALIGPRRGHWVALFFQAAESCDPVKLNKIGRTISRTLCAPVFSAMVYHTEVLFFSVFEKGKIGIEYDSYPEYSGRAGQRYFARSDGQPENLIRFCPRDTALKDLKDVLRRRPQREIIREIAEEEGLESEVDLHFLMSMKEFRNRLKEKIVYVRAQERLADLGQVMGLYHTQFSFQELYDALARGRVSDNYIYLG